MNKTNIDIVDQDSWNWIKDRKNQYELSSVSHVLFRLIDDFRSMDLERLVFLKYIEKFFEYEFFDIDELAFKLNVSKEIVIRLIEKHIGKKVPLFGMNDAREKAKWVKVVHNMMMEASIVPRELSIAYTMRRFIDKNELNLSDYQPKEKGFDGVNVENKLILSLLFPDPEDRRKEIYHHAVNLAKAIMESKVDIPDCEHCNDDCVLKKPDYIYFKSGIEVSLEDLEEDLIASLLKERFGDKYMAYYSLCLILAIDAVIREHLLLVKEFLEHELVIPKESEKIVIFIQMLVNISLTEVRSSLAKDEKTGTFIERYLRDDLLYGKIH